MSPGIPGTGAAIAIGNDAGAWFDLAMRAWGWFEVAREKLRKRRAAGEQLTPEEQAIADMNDEQAFAKLKTDSLGLVDHGEAVRDKHQDVIDQERNEEQPGSEST